MTELYTPRFTTTTTAPLGATPRPTTIAVAATLPALGGGTFSAAIYDVGTDANPTHLEVFQITSGGNTLSWTATTETGWTASTHASGSTVLVTVLTPRSLTQPLTDHVTTATTPDPHSSYVRKDTATTKGDLLVASASAAVSRLGAGSNGSVLRADSTQTLGLTWAAGEVTGTDFKATGLTGATAASRYVGATTTGAPASGTFVAGDFVVDQTGAFWVCTVGGTPGTWTSVGSSAILPTGGTNQVLSEVANAPTVADPLTGPVSAVATTGSANFPPSVTVQFAYAWGTLLGRTGLSPSFLLTSYTTQAAGSVTRINVTVPPSPSGLVTRVLIFAFANGAFGDVQNGLAVQVGSLSTPSTLTNNVVTLTGLPTSFVYGYQSADNGGINIGSLVPSSMGGAQANASVNTTGGFTPTWINNPGKLISQPGDLITGDMQGIAKPLPAGANGQVLTTFTGFNEISDPLVAPIVTPTTGLSTASFTPNTTYFMVYQWFTTENGSLHSAISPQATFTTPSSAIPNYQVTLPVPIPDQVTFVELFLATNTLGPFHFINALGFVGGLTPAVSPGGSWTATLHDITGVISGGAQPVNTNTTARKGVGWTTPADPSAVLSALTTEGDLLDIEIDTGTGTLTPTRVGTSNALGGTLRLKPQNSIIHDPLVAPTLGHTPAGTGLAAGTYTIGYTWTRGFDGGANELETFLSPTTTVTILSGDNISVTTPALPSTTVGAIVFPALLNIYMSYAPDNTILCQSVQHSATNTATITTLPGTSRPFHIKPSYVSGNSTGGYSPHWDTQWFTENVTSTRVGSPVATMVRTGLVHPVGFGLGLVVSARSAVVALTDTLLMTFNQDVTNDYNSVIQQFQTGSTTAASEVLAGTAALVAIVPGASAPAGNIGFVHIRIPFPTLSAQGITKSFGFQGSARTGTIAGSNITFSGGGDWSRTTEPIMEVAFKLSSGSNFAAQSSFYVLSE